jgi:2-polyprenyl-6-hydroxyphenyl methylase/3-demethylubiquinone-9 3-methyltransferase
MIRRQTDNFVQNATDSLRFEFGANWRRFLARITPERIGIAKRSLSEMLEEPELSGRRFLDIGCGSGLFSLAARELGATVHSFDYDAQSVACAHELRRRFRPEDTDWTIERGSVLDQDYLNGLGSFDIVYAWGVLHHTGAMWRALELAANLCAPGGKMFLAIYNDQGGRSLRWHLVKRNYNRLPSWLRLPYVVAWMIRMEGPQLIIHLVRGKPSDYVRSWTDYSLKSTRGMNRWTDLVDWIGGYPFEFAKPEEIFDFFRARGFALIRLATCGGGHACNQFVFRRTSASGGSPHVDRDKPTAALAGNQA